MLCKCRQINKLQLFLRLAHPEFASNCGNVVPCGPPASLTLVGVAENSLQFEELVEAGFAPFSAVS